ncbi:MAG TPA: hypothetical protein VHE35_26405, partial [Kofleriaceae bacterium]|nr:hypothetical protein [Kofleriaceae bacterium]
PVLDAATAVDAAGPPVDAAGPPVDAGPSLRERVEAADPFISLGTPPFSVQQALVSREAYGWFVASLAPIDASGHQPLDHVALAGSATVTSVTFAQARDFCRAIDADLPTSDQWYAFARAKSGAVTVGPESEWTGPDADGVALVREPRDRGREPNDPLYLSTSLAPGAGPESVARATIGFRCARTPAGH